MRKLLQTLTLCLVVWFLLANAAFAKKTKFDDDMFLQCKDGHMHTHRIDYLAHEQTLKKQGNSKGLAVLKEIFSHRDIETIAPNLPMFALAANSLKKPLGGARRSEIKKARDWMAKKYFISIIKRDKKLRRNIVDYYYKLAPMKKIAIARQEALDILNKRLLFGKDQNSALSRCNAFMKEVIGALEMYDIDNNLLEATMLETFQDGSLWSKMTKTGYVSRKLASCKGFYCPTCKKKYELLPKSRERIRLSLRCQEHGEFLSMTKKKKEQEKRRHEAVTAKIERMRKSNLYLRALDVYITKTGLKKCVHNALEVFSAMDNHCSLEGIPPLDMHKGKSLDQIEAILHNEADLRRGCGLRCPVSNEQYAIIYDLPEGMKKRQQLEQKLKRRRRRRKMPVWHIVRFICPKHGYPATTVLPW